MEENVWDLIVAGAGAAGLMAGLRAAERGKRVLLLEKNRKPGVKILMSGGTRCNITHNCDSKAIVKAFGVNGNFLHSALSRFSPQDAVAFFEAEGVATKVEDTGKVFPVSDKAADVLQALVSRFRRSGGVLALEEPLVDLEHRDGLFHARTPKRTATAAKFLLTTGGLSFPGCGTRGDGYPLARKFGHSIFPTMPSLVPVTVQTDWIAELKGITLPDVNVRVMDGGKELQQRRAGFLFAHFGLTGPAPMDVSKSINRHPNPTNLALEIDFAPGRKEPELDQFLADRSLQEGKKQLAVVLSEVWPRRLCDILLEQTGQDVARRAAGLAKADRQKMVHWLKHLRLPVRGTLGYEKAEVTSGGVSLKEVDSRDMQSKLFPGLYFAGEILDVDGPIGGFNFQAAWATGWLAGSSV